MAYVQYTDGHRELPDEETAVKLWRIKSGQAKPMTKAQKQYCSRIRREVKVVVLNWHEAPEDYIRANLSHLIPQIVGSWVRDRTGRPLRPGTAADWDFAKKYGLWRGRKPTQLVTGGQQQLIV